MATTALQKAAEANQKAAAIASRIQLDTTQELNGRLEQLIQELKQTHEELQADKELIESDIAARSSQIEQMDNQIAALIRLHSEMTEMVRVIYEARED